MDDSDADLYAEFHGGKMTPESTSSSEGSYISLSRSFERRGERNRLAIDRYNSDFTPDLASTIYTDFAAIPAKDSDNTGSPSRGFDFQGWFQDVYDEHHRLVRETTPREQRVHSAGNGSYLSPPDDQRVRSYSHGK
jgi:hypothetical protein